MSSSSESRGCGASLIQGIKKAAKPIFSQTRQLEERKRRGLHPVCELSRFHLLVCCYFCSVCVSLTYAFDLFTTQFRSQFNLSSSDLTTISTVGLVFCYFTIPYSFIFENLGPFLTFWMCAIAATIGGVGLVAVFNGHIAGNTATITVFYAFLNAASGLIDTSYVSTLFEVFPRNRGPVVCLAKVMTGLGSSVLAALSDTVFENTITGFIYFIMALCIAVSIWASFVMVLPPYLVNWWRRQGKTKAQIAALQSTVVYYDSKFVPLPRLIIGYTVVISLLVFFTVEAPVLAYMNNVSHGAKMAIGAVTIVLTLSIFLMLLPLRCLGGMNDPAPELEMLEDSDSVSRRRSAEAGEVNKGYNEEMGVIEMRTSNNDESSPQAGSGEPFMGVHPEHNSSSESVEAVEEDYTYQDPRYKGTIWDYLKSLDLWLIILLFVCYGCMGILVMYNSSTISVALTGKQRSGQLSALYTAFLGVGSSVGRIGFGLFEAYVQHQDPENRRFLVTMALPFSPLLSFLGGLFLLVLPGEAVLFPFILVYLEEGVFAGVNALIFPCLFESNHNFLYNISFLVQMCTIISFNLGMFGRSINKEQRRLGIPLDQDCTVKSCVRTPLIVGTVLGFCGIFVALAIHFRYAAFVHRERARVKKARMEAEAAVSAKPEECLE
ncbi:hypothetical protein ABB37_06491 [Leptomonas pyrrhocoris]|uniref:Nodulin-like domain-containing protein n=1 Tax=Leptomonas pyrrhocoris TaxID=157538 RepID=A0A0N0DU53_LEPPY|nr:hypothetical protein ABB37_06491 [Leptomonas pyrrhocoris]KPA78372.1 hypothetical protein ABB37_06491 [Leptomonas pyrrhocoris]|eukprot:XP_015656811.1 hypothetical protein ABB37_06491 [Leptomonas pyrrhocoris]